MWLELLTFETQTQAPPHKYTHLIILPASHSKLFFGSFPVKQKNSRTLDFPRFLLSYKTGDERIELPLKVLETSVIPFDQSPIDFISSKLHTCDIP